MKNFVQERKKDQIEDLPNAICSDEKDERSIFDSER